MPTFPDPLDVTRKTGTAYTIQLRDHRGKARSTRLQPATAATNTELDALRDAIGNVSNAALVATNLEAYDEIVNLANPNVVAYDEGYSSVDHVMVLVFQNDDGDVQTIEVAAPDLSCFDADGETVVLTGTGNNVPALITAATNALNSDGAGGYAADSYAYARGYLSTRSGSRARKRTPIKIQEPGVTDLPGDPSGT